jgi:hypothetical protein
MPMTLTPASFGPDLAYRDTHQSKFHGTTILLQVRLQPSFTSIPHTYPSLTVSASGFARVMGRGRILSYAPQQIPPPRSICLPLLLHPSRGTPVPQAVFDLGTAGGRWRGSMANRAWCDY